MATKEHQMLSKSTITGLVNWALKQGPVFALLLFLWYQDQQKINRLETKVEQCRQEQIDVYRAQNKEMIKVVQINAEAFEKFSYQLDQWGK